MSEYDRVRDTQNDGGDEELDESTVNDAEKREEGPAAEDETVSESPTETAASPTDNESIPAENAAPDTAPRDDEPEGTGGPSDAPSTTVDEKGAHAEGETAPPSPGSHEATPEHGHGEHAHEGEHDDRTRPHVILEAGTDERSLRALELCREKVKELRLHMHPLAARYDDERHITIFFRADDKVDFRKLVRELSRLLHARIEMRQLGPREQGRLCGLVGKCGYPLCCRTFLGQFAQSSIKMAKTQDLALNPMKISGVCGRLLCCLNYEQEMYSDMKSHMPKINKFVDTEFGRGKVIGLNVLKQTVTVLYEGGSRELSLEQVKLSEGHAPHSAQEDTSASQNESRSNDTEHDTRSPGEPQEH